MFREILLYVIAFGLGFGAAQVWMLLMIRHEVGREASRFLWRVMGGSDN